jgi:hypothetical protein
MKLTHIALASALSMAAGFGWSCYNAINVAVQASAERTAALEALDSAHKSIDALMGLSVRDLGAMKLLGIQHDRDSEEIARLTQELDGEREVRVAAQAELTEARAWSIAWTPAVANQRRGARK